MAVANCLGVASKLRAYTPRQNASFRVGNKIERKLVVSSGLLSAQRGNDRVPKPPVSGHTDSLLEQLASAGKVSPANNPFPVDELSMPVYSLSTNGTGCGGGPSMNILTYASLVSLKPRIYAIGLSRDTLTWQNFIDTRTGVLQILRKKHLPLVELLGRSGRDVDKIKEAQVQGFVVAEFLGQNVIADAFGLVELELISQPMTVGDHDVVICEVGEHLTNRKDASDVLTTKDVRDAGFETVPAPPERRRFA